MPSTLDDSLNAFAESTESLADTQSHPSYAMPTMSSFDTALSPGEEQKFQAWKARYAPHDSGHDYDLRGAYKAGFLPDPQTGHWPDTYKKPNHPTFSDQSVYSSLTGTRPGTWQGETYVPASSPLDSSLQDFTSQGEADQLRGAVELGAKRPAGAALRTLQLVGKTGLPHDFVDRNLDYVDQEASKQDFNPQQLMKDSPAFASWLAESPDHVAVAKPDVPALSFIEKQLRNIPAQYQQGQRTVEYGNVMLDVAKGLLDKTDVSLLRKRQAELEADMSAPDQTGLAEAPGVSGVLQRAPGWMAQQLPILGSTLTEQVKSGATGVAGGALLGRATGGLPGATVGGLAVGGAMWRLGAAFNSAKMEFGQAFGDYEKLKDINGEPLDQETAMGLAGMVGVINGSIDGFFGIEGLTSKLPGINQFTRQGVKELLKTPTTRAAVLSYAKTVGQVMATEGVTEALQMYITKAGGVALQAVKDGGSPSEWIGKIFSPENLKQAATEAEAGAFGGGGIATVMAAPKLAQDISQVRAANQAKQAFEAIGKAVEGTKLSQDLPGPLRDIIERATKDGPIETLYVPTHAFNEYFQKEGVSPREVYKEVTGDAEAYDQAVETGADLPITAADYAQKLAGTKHNKFFANELRTSIDAMNGFEAAEWVKQQDAQDQAAAEQPGVQAISATRPAVQVRMSIAGQLASLGFSPTVIDQYAALFEARYRARAERRGLGETAAQLFEQQNLNITRPVPAVLQQLGNTTELDALLDRLRSGDLPKPNDVFGQSLTEFLKKAGGVQDQGGELASRNVDAATKPFTKKLVQKKGLTLDEAAQRATEAGYLDARDLNKLLDALDQEARGTPVFALGKENARAFDVQQNLESLKSYLEAKGIDLKTATNAQIKQLLGEAVQQTLPAEEGQTFAQTFQASDTPKGSITFGGQSINIKLLEKADLSTFIHETGHLYLNELIDDATTAGVSPQLTTDINTVLKWMGLEVTAESGAAAIKAAIQTRHHEQFARGFEAYTMEGKSPSQAMREVFAAFRQWLIQAYRSLTTAPLNVKLTNPVREVMDRMIATDEEIDRAATEADVHPMFTNAIAAGMSSTEFAAYQETVAKASLTARETLQKQLMAQYQRQQAQWWKDETEALRLEITRTVNQQKEYVALSVLQTGTMPDGSALPTGVEPMKLDRKSLAAQFGQDFLARMPNGTTSKNGMHQDTAAQLFGFNSGQELVLAIVNARPKVPLINAEADQQMQDRHGDMRFDGSIAEAARAAVMNDQQEQVIAAEIRALNAKQREVAPFVKAAKAELASAKQQGRALLRTMIPTLEDTRKLARGILARTSLRQLNPYHYSVAARQASKHATNALGKQEYLEAGLFKQRELLNLALFREALLIKQQIEQAHELAKQFWKSDETLAKSRNVDLINVGRAILAQYGLARPMEKTAADYLAPIKTYDVDLYDQWKPQVDALAPRPLDYNALTVEEFTTLFDNLNALWLLSRRTKQMKINEQLIDRKQIVDELSAAMSGFTKQQKDQVVGAQTPWADTSMGLLSWGSALKRVESWVRRMDGGNIDGIFRRYIWTPISEASDQFREAKKGMLQQYLELIKPIEKMLTRDLIPAPELGPNVAFRGKTALLHAVLHTGNDSNQSKLLRGYNWTPGSWQTFLDRMYQQKILTKLDYDFAQGVWDLLESVKPQAQQAHHEMYGYYFNEITARDITTPFGTYKGGYVPAIADRAKSVDQAIREEKDLFDQAGNSFMFPTTGRGFTKARVEQYAAPLALDMTTIPVHLDKTMRFVHLEPRIKDAARLVTNKGFRQALDAMNSTVAKDMLVPWLQRSAQQKVAKPGSNPHADALWRYLRKSTGAQIMVGNVINTLQQFTGFPIAATMVKARYLRGAMMNYLRHPIEHAETIAAKSTFMRGRTTTQIIEIQQTIDDILLNPTKYDQVRKFLERHGYFMQQGTQNLVDLVTWGGAYDQAIAQDLDERMAVRAADSAVRLTQGTFAPEDLSAFEAGTPFTRAFTMFYSYFNMQANLLTTETQIVAHEMGLRKGAGRALWVYTMGFMIPAVLSEALILGIGGFDPDDDDDYLNEALSVFFGSQLRTALAMVPGVGPVTLAGIGYFTSKQYDDRISTSPIVQVLESAGRVPRDLYQVMSEGGHSKRTIRDVLTLIGLVTGLPAGALSRPLGYLGDVYDGVAQPETAGDVARGLVSGKDVNRTK